MEKAIMTWVDFQAVRENLDVLVVLEHYGFDTRRNGQDQVKVCCPFHDDKNPSCGFNTAKRVFNCFSCGAKGNVLDFIARMEGFDPDAPRELREAALFAVETFGIDGGAHDGKSGNQPKAKARPEIAKKSPKGPQGASQTKARSDASNMDVAHAEGEAEADGEAPANPPLTFTLQLDPSHPFLRDQQVSKALVEEFGLGYAKRGSMKGRICFPIHNEDGELIAYAGRWADEALPADTPRYLLPKGFEKRLVLFNLHRLCESGMPETVVVVEGFWSVLRLHAAGVPAVATFGASVSDEQADLLAEAGAKKCILIFDGDDGGRAGLEQALPVLSQRLFVRSIPLDDGIKPDTMDDAILQGLPGF